MDTDRNLLFGVLALQADLIDPDTFARACALWAADKSRPLADVLVAQGWLAPDDRADVSKLLERKLKKHGGDAKASLAEAASPRARQALATLDDPDVRASLAGPTPPAPGHVLLNTSAHVPEGRDRYTLTRLHATGGLGRVWVARDDGLGRDVALKELRPERVDNPAVWARFLKEAKVTGQLEHPGIVPVYELARRPGDDQPFYTMRFVRGRTLAEATAAYHARREKGDAGPLELRELLTAVVGVCHAVAYAHSRGVLHRDLKPQNVVLGDFGEVIVLDWGLAKVVGDADDDRPPVDLGADLPDRQTVAGQVLGTPAYMAPEQAEGRLDKLDPRTDVYGLGAILYEVLTGRPPFTGGDTQSVIRRVIHEPPERPRSIVAKTPAALEAVCLKALAKDPRDRYADAAELADDLRHWLADEPVSARRDPRADRFARWVRKNKSWAWAAAASLEVIALVATAAAGLIYFSRQEAIQAREDAEARQKEAVDNLARANRNLRTAQDAVRDSFHQIAASDLASVPGAGRMRLQLAGVALTYNERFLAEHPDHPDVRWDAADMYRTMGSLYAGANQPEQSLAFYRRSLDQLRQLAADAPSDDRLRGKLLAYRMMLAKVCREAGAMLRARGRHAEARPLLDEGLGLLTRPPDDGRGPAIRAPGTGDPWDANPAVRDAWPADPLALPAPPAEPRYEHKFVHPFLRVKGQLLVELARLHLDEGRAADALAFYDQVAAFFRPGVDVAGPPAPEGDGMAAQYVRYSRPELDPWYLGWALRGRAAALSALGRPTEADAAYAEAVRRLDGLARPDDRYLLATILVSRGIDRSNASDLDRGLAVLERLARDFGRAGYRREYARGLIARAGLRAGDRAADYRTARQVSEDLIAGSEGKPAADDLANLADALVGLGGPDALRQAVGRYEEALAICPAHAEYRRKLTAAKAKLGGG